jgi:hypothetical protein
MRNAEKEVFILGTPMLIAENDRPLIVFHAAETANWSKKKHYARVIYCIRLNWDRPNDIVWRTELGVNTSDKPYLMNILAELGAADLDGDGHIEIAATASLYTPQVQVRFVFSIISAADGTIVRSSDHGYGDSITFSRFVIADAGPGPRVIFFPEAYSKGDYNQPQTQPACADINGNGTPDFYLRGKHGMFTPQTWMSVDCFFRVSLDLVDIPKSPLEPVICPLNEDNISEMFVIDNDIAGNEIWQFNHLALSRMDDTGRMILAGASPDGMRVDTIGLAAQTDDPRGWAQAYGDACRTNTFIEEAEGEISISLSNSIWEFDIGLNKSIANISADSRPMHTVKNKGSIPVDLKICYVGVTGCDAGTEPGVNTFAVDHGYYHGEPIPAEGKLDIQKDMVPGDESDIPLIYYSPTSLTNNAVRMDAIFEIIAYPAAD